MAAIGWPAPSAKLLARAGGREGETMDQPIAHWRSVRPLAIATTLILSISVAGPAFSATSSGSASPGLALAAEEDNPNDIPACDADDPDFGTNCEAADDEAELRDGYLDSRQVPGDVITSGDLDLAAQQAAAV